MQKYEIQSVIGQGAYGVVLKCKSNETKQLVAIKKFKQSEQDEMVRKVTMRQVKILKNMKNQNVVELRDAFRRKGIVYLVFQYVENNLLEVLEKSPEGLEPEVIKRIIYQLIKGLAYMHSNNVIHRDIKPENLLISDKKQLKICDFGFARTMRKKGQQYTDYVATRWYRPPELLVSAPYGPQIDIWAVGCIMAELIDGNPLFPGQDQFDQLFQIQKSLGPLTPDHSETFLKNPRFLGMKFPSITTLQTIEKKYLGKLSQKALNFLKQTLRLNPAQRPTAVQALKHPYFDGIRQNDIVRKYSATNYAPQYKMANSTKEEYPNSVSYQRKKIPTNIYNPPILTSHLQRERTEQVAPSDNLFNTRHGGKFHGSKKSRDDIKNFQLTSKGFNNNVQSKSVNKTQKMSKLKQKYMSLEKGKHRDHTTQTQAGFYQKKSPKIDIHETEISKSKRNKIYNIQNPKSRNQKNRSIVNTEEIYEQDEGMFSASQLPFLMVASQQTKGAEKMSVRHEKQSHKGEKHEKYRANFHSHLHNYGHSSIGNQNPNLNIIISNSVFNYKN